MNDDSFPQGTEVVFKTETLNIKGKVVGKSMQSVTNLYILECTDTQLPNETYSYTHFTAPKAFLTKI